MEGVLQGYPIGTGLGYCPIGTGWRYSQSGLDWVTLHWNLMRVPPSGLLGTPGWDCMKVPHPGVQSSRASTCYMMSAMPFAFMQEDILICWNFKTISHKWTPEAVAFSTVNYAFFHFSWHFFFNNLNLHLCRRIIQNLFWYKRLCFQIHYSVNQGSGAAETVTVSNFEICIFILPWAFFIEISKQYYLKIFINFQSCLWINVKILQSLQIRVNIM